MGLGETHVAGTVGGNTTGVAKQVTLVGVRVLDCSGSGSYSGIIAAVDSVTKEQAAFPDCALRFYTLAEILNALIGAGFRLCEFREHPHWDNAKIPGEFTILAEKMCGQR